MDTVVGNLLDWVKCALPFQGNGIYLIRAEEYRRERSGISLFCCVMEYIWNGKYTRDEQIIQVLYRIMFFWVVVIELIWFVVWLEMHCTKHSFVWIFRLASLARDSLLSLTRVGVLAI